MLHRTLLRILALLVVVGLLSPPESSASPGTYPKKFFITWSITQMSESVRDSAAQFDVIVSGFEEPEVVQDVRSRNADLVWLYSWIPHMAIVSDTDDSDFWLPDTTWSLRRLIQLYRINNPQWIMRDTDGEIIEFWNSYMMNWTRYCPEGTYGTSRGLTYAEWLVNVAMPQIMQNSPEWEPWGIGASSYDGLWFEAFFDCWGSSARWHLENADPDGDGLPEGVHEACTVGGDQDSLSILIGEINEEFFQDFRAHFGDNIPFTLNTNNKYMGPTWRHEAWGLKLERWLWDFGGGQDWWNWFYGFTNWNGSELWGPGYEYAERYHHTQGPDEWSGWDLTFLELYTRSGWNEQERQRWKRWALGTSLLGDGYVTVTADEDHLIWIDEYDWDLGDPLDDYKKEIRSSTDTLYIRNFSEGVVVVNPQEHVVGGFPAQDAFIGFWQTLNNVEVAEVGAQSATVRWTAPDNDINPVDEYEVRYATFPVDNYTWLDALVAPGSPFTGDPGAVVEAEIPDLDDNTTYYAAVRNAIRDRLDPEISNAVNWTTDPIDTEPPAPTPHIESPDQGLDWIDVRWTASGDDGMEGQAASYAMRYLPGRAIETENDWDLSYPVVGLPDPGPPGTAEEFRITGLDENSDYGIAVRIYDEVPNESGLSAPLVVSTEEPPPPPPEDTSPPGEIEDIFQADSSRTSVLLQWTATGDDGDVGQATAYRLAYRLGDPIESELDWNASFHITEGLPAPAPAGTEQQYLLEDLEAGTSYGVALRAVDDVGLRGPISPPLVVRTAEKPPPPPEPDSLAPTPIVDLHTTDRGEVWLDLAWTAPEDRPDGISASRYILGFRPGAEITTEEEWETSTIIDSGLPQPGPPGMPDAFRLESLRPGTLYGIAIRSEDAHGNLSLLSAPFSDTTLDSPPPADSLPPDSIDDLHLIQADTIWAVVSWTAPEDEGGSGLASYEIRYAVSTEPLGESGWEDAVPLADPPAPSAPGEPETLRLEVLEPETSYALAIRTADGEGNVSGLSNPLVFQTLAETPPVLGDSIPPAALSDLEIADFGATWIRLQWTMTGDDGTEGQADAILARWRAGESPIVTEEDWEQAQELDPPAAQPPGTFMEWTVLHLSPESTYALALRVRDDEGNVSEISPPVVATTLALPDTTPPDAVMDLTPGVTGMTDTWLYWTAPEDPDGEVTSYILGWLEGVVSWDEELWGEALKDSASMPRPSEPGATDSVRVEDLSPDTFYSFTVRAHDAAGNISPLGLGVVVLTEAEPDTSGDGDGGEDGDDEEDDADEPPAISGLEVEELGETWIRLSWIAPLDTGSVVIRYVLAVKEGKEITTESDWETSTHLSHSLPPPGPPGVRQAVEINELSPGTGYGFAVRGTDAKDRLSPLSASVWIHELLPRPVIPPESVSDLTAADVGSRSALIRWTAPGSPGGGVANYELGLHRQPITDENWEGVGKVDGAPMPQAPGSTEEWRVQDLQPGETYYMAIRSRSWDGIWSPLSNPLTVTTLNPDAVPPVAPSGLEARWSGTDDVLLTWRPVGDPDLVGYHVYQARGREGFRCLTGNPVPEARYELANPEGEAQLRFAVSAVDVWGLESSLSREIELFPNEIRLAGPFPHPARSSARFLLTLPPSKGGAIPVRASLYSVAGRVVNVLYDGDAPAGRVLEINWDGRTKTGRVAAPGYYLLRVKAGSSVRHLKVFFVR